MVDENDKGPETQPRPPEPRPPEKPTVQMAAVDPVQVLLSKVDKIQGTLSTLSADKIAVATRLDQFQESLDEFGERIGKVETRQTNTSERVRGASESDASIKAAQAAEIIKNEERDRKIAETHELATNAASKEDVAAVAKKADTAIEKVAGLTESQKFQTEILKRVDRLFDFVQAVAKHPLTKLVLAILTLTLGGYAASKGIK